MQPVAPRLTLNTSKFVANISPFPPHECMPRSDWPSLCRCNYGGEDPEDMIIARDHSEMADTGAWSYVQLVTIRVCVCVFVSVSVHVTCCVCVSIDLSRCIALPLIRLHIPHPAVYSPQSSWPQTAAFHVLICPLPGRQRFMCCSHPLAVLICPPPGRQRFMC